jgi:hypothetical protein
MNRIAILCELGGLFTARGSVSTARLLLGGSGVIETLARGLAVGSGAPKLIVTSCSSYDASKQHRRDEQEYSSLSVPEAGIKNYTLGSNSATKSEFPNRAPIH